MLQIMNFKGKLFNFFYGAILLLCTNLAYAVADPVATMQNITNEVLASLQQNKQAIENSPDKLYALIYRSVVPHVDFDEISVWVAGRKAWNNASATEKAEFIKQFKFIVVRTYASALKKYSDEKVTFLPLRSKNISKRMQLSSSVWDPNTRKRIKVDFRIIQSGDSWKAYDLIIEGVSLLKGFQAQFSDVIRNEGINAAIEKMRVHNVSVMGDELAKSLAAS